MGWPSSLPQEPNGSIWGNQMQLYTETPPDTTIRDKNDTGPDNVRRRCLAMPRRLTLYFHLEAAQVDVFDAWFWNDLQGGVLSFAWTWPPAPRASQAVQMRFVSVPSYEHRGMGVHDLTLQLEILP